MSVELLSILKSSHQEVFCKKGVFKIFKFTGKHLCQSLSFNRVADFRPEIQKISKNTFYYRTPPVAASKSFSENLLLWMLTLNFMPTKLSLTELDVKFALNLVLLLLNRINVYPFSHKRNKYSITHQVMWSGVSVEAGDWRFLPTIETQMTWKSPGINP